MRVLLLGRKQIAKSEDIITAFKSLHAQVDFVLFPGFHYTKQNDTYETSLGTYPSPSTHSRKSYYFKHFFRIISFLFSRYRKNQYDILLAIDWLEGVILVLYKYLFARESTLIFYSYDFYFFDSIFSSRFFINKIDSWVARHADEVWNVNDAIRQEREKAGVFAKKNSVVPLGIFTKGGVWKLKNPKSFLFVGNFKPGHNLEKLVEVFVRLLQSDAHFRLTLVGHGNLEDRIKTLLEKYEVSPKSIRLRGFVSEEDLLEEIQQGEYVYGIALYERTREVTCVDPGKVKDYLSWNLPVLMTRTNAIAGDIEKYRLGRVINSDDMEVLEQIFRESSLDDTDEMRENIRRYSETRTFENIIQSNLSI